MHFLSESPLLSDPSLSWATGRWCVRHRLRYSFVFTSSCFAFKSFSSSRVSVSRSADVLYMDGYLWNMFVSPGVA